MFTRKRSSSCAPNYSVRLCTLLLVISLMTSSTPVLVGAAAGVTSSSRWIYPCAGGVAVEGMNGDVTGLVLGSEDGVVELISRVDWPATLHTLSDTTVRLKRRVRDLKNLYVRFRFRDDSLVQDLEQMGLRLEGMPPVHQPTIAAVNNENMISTLHMAFEYLARVAVFLEQARIGENLALNENVSFETDFRQLEDDHEMGIYWLLCAIHRVIHASGEQLRQETLGDIMRMRVVEVDRNSLRHTRDYLVLRDFEKLLDRLNIEFSSLRNMRPIF